MSGIWVKIQMDEKAATTRYSFFGESKIMANGKGGGSSFAERGRRHGEVGHHMNEELSTPLISSWAST